MAAAILDALEDAASEVEATSPREVPEAAGAARPMLTGWATKKKSEGARGRALCSSNRRFYSVDFEAQVVYYAHAEDSRSVSMPVPFRDLVKVEATCDVVPTSSEDSTPRLSETPTMQRSDSKGSLGSKASSLLRPRMPRLFALSRRPAEQHGLVLHTTTKATELYFASKPEADMWIEAFEEAIALGASDPARDDTGRQEVSTAPGSSSGTASATPRSTAGESVGDADFCQSQEQPGERTTPASIAPMDLRSGLSPKLPRPAGAQELSGEAAAGAQQAFLAAKEPVPNSPTSLASPPRLRAVAAGPAPGILGASMQSEGGLSGSNAPRNFSLSISGQHAWGYGRNNPEDVDTEELAQSKVNRYADKAQGLTLQERLAQLDFSDNEEEDEDDPTAAARKPSARGLQERACRPAACRAAAAVPQPEVTMEACEAFVQEPDSSDDD